MFARVTHVHALPGKLGDVARLYQDAVVPLLQRQPGFKHTSLLTNFATDKGMSITYWATEADRQAADSNGFLLAQIVKVIPMLAVPPVPESYLAKHTS